jgi:hypothetical protein
MRRSRGRLAYVLAFVRNQARRRGGEALASPWESDCQDRQWSAARSGRTRALACRSAETSAMRRLSRRLADISRRAPASSIALVGGQVRHTRSLGCRKQRSGSPESTTSDLVERTRAFIAAANRRDFDAMVAFYAPDAVWHKSGTLTARRRSAISMKTGSATMRSTRSRS